jgi:zinc transport system permease protein
MFDFITAITQFSFLQYALIAGILASIGCGIIGSYVVVKKISFLAGGVAHAALGGMGVAYYLQQPVLLGALVVAVGVAWFIGWVHLHSQQQEDTLIAAVWASGMAIGVIFIAQTPGYNVDLISYLFGNILMVNSHDLYLMLGLDIIIIFTVLFSYKYLLAICFDSEFSQLRAVPVGFFYLLLLTMVALTVILLIRVVGLILVIALLTIPPAIALQYVISLWQAMLWSSFLGIIFTVIGLFLAYTYNLPAGASIILIATISYLFSTLILHYIIAKFSN